MRKPAHKYRTYIIRTCNADMTSRGGFEWPLSGFVSCPDWIDNNECGNGLHGLLHGIGGIVYLSDAADAKWIVASVDSRTTREIDGDKVKFPYAWVEFVGNREDAVDYLQRHDADAMNGANVYANKSGGDRSTLTGGDRSTLTGGYGSTLTGGYGSTLTGGAGSTLTGGDRSTLIGHEDCIWTIAPNCVLSWWDYTSQKQRCIESDTIAAGIIKAIEILIC
jgi:hypothetical protein